MQARPNIPNKEIYRKHSSETPSSHVNEDSTESINLCDFQDDFNSFESFGEGEKHVHQIQLPILPYKSHFYQAIEQEITSPKILQVPTERGIER